MRNQKRMQPRRKIYRPIHGRRTKPRMQRRRVVNEWGTTFWDEVRARLAHRPTEAVGLAQWMVEALGSGIRHDRFGSHGFAFNEVLRIVLGKAVDLAERGYFEVVQSGFPHVLRALESVEPWDSIKRLQRRAHEDFYMEAILPAQRWLAKDSPNALERYLAPLGLVRSRVSYSGTPEEMALASPKDPQTENGDHERYSHDPFVHEFFIRRYGLMPRKKEDMQKQDKEVEIRIGRFSWHCMIETDGNRIAASLPQGFARAPLVKLFVVKLVHGVLWQNGVNIPFCWLDFPCSDDFWSPCVIPQVDSVKEWMARIRALLRGKDGVPGLVKTPAELTLFKPMLAFNEAIYAKNRDAHGVMHPLVKDGLTYMWNPVERDIRLALEWYIEILGRLKRQEIVNLV